jgi:cell volume regulation protein A
MHADKLIILVSSTLLLSYISSLAYSKTKIPDIIWLIGFGILVGPVLNLFDKSLFLELANLMSVLALSIILFEAGINVDIVTLLQTMTKAAILSITTILTVIVSVGFTLNYFMPQDFTLLQAMLLGSMIGGTSTVSVYGILTGLSRTLDNIKETRVLLTMESVVSDPVCIIASITLLKMITLPNVSIQESFRDIFSIFTLSSILGIIIGLIWANILNRLRGHSLTYMITLSVLFPSYLISEFLIGEGGGAMTALTFGLGVTNYRYIMNRFGAESKIRIDKSKLREFHEEVSFFIKSFFFVYIGLIVSLSLRYTIIGFGVVVLIMILRFIIVQGIGGVLMFTREEKVLSQAVYASGLPAFVMAQLPIIYDPNADFFVNPSIYQDLCMPIVLGTVIYSAIAGPLLSNRFLKAPEEREEEKDEEEFEETQ